MRVRVYVVLALAAMMATSSGCAGLLARGAATAAAERWALLQTAEAVGTGVMAGMVIGEFAQGSQYDPGNFINSGQQSPNATPQLQRGQGYSQNRVCSYPDFN